MQTRLLNTMFVAFSLSLGACATTGGVNNMQMMQTEEGQMVQPVHGLSMADPAPMQCQTSTARHDLVCQPAAGDHLYAQTMGLDEAPNAPKFAATTPSTDENTAKQCNVERDEVCTDGQVASDED